MTKQVHTVIRLYHSGEFKILGILDSELDDCINYNKTYRSGCALFVDGINHHKGYSTHDQIREFECRVLSEKIIHKTLNKKYE